MSGLEILGALSTGLGVIGAIQEGQYANASAKAQAKALERKADEERAASQRQAIRRAQEANLLLSKQQAQAASSGGGATDPTVVRLAQGIAAEGAYQTAGTIFEGESRATGLMDQAALTRWEGKQRKRASFINAGTTLLSGMSEWQKYRPRSSTGFNSQFNPY